eukprot:CAMPEP_0169078546 /NCGR_PEP_ID=MMETSP1015-20121227/9467_1 /TAXON_ID=342587 /ORGANISM="Karlodinium micrum, Strain CCMP2283" /LENGTH=354 /DNA_ID=CAMNT_0009138139 /DNA_START=51 /DNA_END=1115 /DNA_ORIENTATION=+
MAPQATKQLDLIDAGLNATRATPAIQQVDSLDAKVNPVVLAQLSKTKMCSKFAKGACNDPNCGFAHSRSELRSKLDLSKTAMCRLFAKGMCSNENCKFAHSERELRVTQNVYKTQLCNFYQRGHCKKGNKCRHAHGDHELRSCSPLNLPTDSDDTGCPSDDNTDGDFSPKESARGEVAMPYEVQDGRESILTTEPMKITLPPFSPEPIHRRMPLQSPPQHRQPLFAQSGLPYPLGEQMARFVQVPGVSDPQLVATTGFIGDGFPDGARQATGRMAYAQQMAKAAELELQTAFLKAHLQIKQAAEIVAAAGRMGDSMACMNALRGQRGETLLADAFGTSQMQPTTEKLTLPPGLY